MMDHDLVLKIFYEAIDYFFPFVNNSPHIVFLVELGICTEDGMNKHFQKNVGRDFVDSVSARCIGNGLMLYDPNNITRTCHKDIVQERYYRYSMTPFDVRCRVFRFYTHDENVHHVILRKGDNYFECNQGTVIFFNTETGRLGLFCDFDRAKNIASNTSEFYLLHSCFLIMRDIVNMCETVLDDKVSFKSLSMDLSPEHPSSSMP